MSASVIFGREMADWRLVIHVFSWALLCLCWQESECIQLMQMCGHVTLPKLTNRDTNPHELSKTAGGSSSKPRQTLGSNRFIILSYQPPKSQKYNSGTHSVSRFTRMINAAVVTAHRNSSQRSTSKEYGTTTSGFGGGKGNKMMTANKNPSTPITTPGTSYGGHTAHGQEEFPCGCEVSSSARFSLYIIDKLQAQTVTSKTLKIADGCTNHTIYEFKDLKNRATLNFNDRDCKNNSDSVISIKVKGMALSLLLAFEESADNLTVRCGSSQVSSQENQTRTLPHVEVIPRHIGTEKTGGIGGKQPNTRGNQPSGKSSSAVHLMILSFVCLLLLIFVVGFFLLWRRSRLDYISSTRRKRTRRETEKPEYNNYEEISEVVYSRQTSQSKKDAEKTSRNREIQQQVSTGSTRKIDMHFGGTDGEDNYYHDSRSDLQREYSIPDVDEVLSLEYSTAKDSIDVKPRPLMRLPGNPTSRNRGLASYEDLPYYHHHHHHHHHRPNTDTSSLTIDNKTAKRVQSTPELHVVRKSNNSTRSKSVSKLSAIRFHSSDSKRYWLLEDSTQTGHYCELLRNYNSGPLDVSKLALYDSMLNTGSTCSSRMCETATHRSSLSDNRSSSRNLSQGSVSMQAGEYSTRRDGPIYEDVTCDIEAKAGVGRINEAEKHVTSDGVEKREKCDARNRPETKNIPYIIDLSEFKKSPKDCNQTRSSASSLALLSSALNTASCQDQSNNTQSQNDSKQFSLSIPTSTPPSGVALKANHEKGYHDDDGVVMIENDIYRSCGSHPQEGECESQPAPRQIGKGPDSGIMLDDSDDGPCGDCQNKPKVTLTRASPTTTGEKRRSGVVMIQNSIYQSSGEGQLDVDDITSCGRHSSDATVCDECNDLVLVENSIYNSTQL